MSMPEYVIIAERADGTRYVLWTTDSRKDANEYAGKNAHREHKVGVYKLSVAFE